MHLSSMPLRTDDDRCLHNMRYELPMLLAAPWINSMGVTIHKSAVVNLSAEADEKAICLEDGLRILARIIVRDLKQRGTNTKQQGRSENSAPENRR